MKKIALIIGLFIAFGIGYGFKSVNSKESKKTEEKSEKKLKLGAFSLSLNVKDLKVAMEFYENLGFVSSGGDMAKNYLIMKNEHTIIGLFQGYFEGNMLTFNPGWDENAKNIKKFDDVREIQKRLKSNNVTLINEADEKTTGPAYITFKDPDGNLILMDQHR